MRLDPDPEQPINTDPYPDPDPLHFFWVSFLILMYVVKNISI